MEAVQSLRRTFASTALELAERDEKVVVLVGDISHGLFGPFRERFPDRYLNVGILEPAMASIAAGLSLVGLRPIVHTIAPFLIERSFEQLKLDFGYQGLSGMFVSVGGAFDYSYLGCTHHSYIDLSMVASLDDSRVVSPVSSFELSSLMKQAHDDWSGLTYVKLTENGIEDYPRGDAIRLGSPVVIGQTSSRIAVVSVGPTFVQVRQALEEFDGSDRPSHIHVHTIKPIRFEELDSMLAQATHILIVEQSFKFSGLASQFALRKGWSVPRVFHSMGIDSFVRNYGSYQELLEESHLNDESIAERIRAIMDSIPTRDLGSAPE